LNKFSLKEIRVALSRANIEDAMKAIAALPIIHHILFLL